MMIKKAFYYLSFLTITFLAIGQPTDISLLSNDQIEQLYKLGKVWGYLKYYHPDVTKGKFDWDQELFEQIHQTLNRANNNDANQQLLDWVRSIGKSPKQIEYITTNKIKLSPPLNWLEDDSILGDNLSLELLKYKNAKRGKKSHYVEVYDELAFLNESNYPSFNIENKELLLLSLFRYWNIIEYFYPYRYLTNDWDLVMKRYIPRFFSLENSLSYKLLIKELVAEINDTHGYVIDNELKKYFGARTPAIDVRQIENKFVVYRLLPGFEHSHNLRVGDVIFSIDNLPIKDRIAQLEKYAAASNEVMKEFVAIKLALRTNNEILKVKLEDGRSAELTTHDVYDIRLDLLLVSSNQVLNNNIGYLYLGSIEPGTMDQIFQSFNNTKGLIVDMRCYPSYTMYELINYISPVVADFIIGTDGSISQPGLFTFNPVTHKVSENPDYYKNKIVVLVDELTISQSESYAMAFQVNPKTTILGSTTGGADGDIIPITLPGDVTTFISSWGVYYPDGSEAQGLGIIPDIVLRPSLNGLKEGKDELIDLAIEIINSGN